MLLATTLPALLRFAAVTPGAALAILVIAASLTAWGIAFGTLFGNARGFEIVFCLLLYLGLNKHAVLNVLTDPLGTSVWHATLLPLAVLLALWRWPRVIRA